MTILYIISGLLVFLCYMIIGKFIRLWLSEIFLETGRKFINLDHLYGKCIGRGCEENHSLLGVLGLKLFNFALWWRASVIFKIFWIVTVAVGLLLVLIGFFLRIFYYSLSYKREFSAA